jgi:hypothetical protein
MHERWFVSGQSVGSPKWLQYGYSYSYDFSCDLPSLVRSPTASANGPQFAQLYGLDLYDMYLVIGGADVAAGFLTAVVWSYAHIRFPFLGVCGM